MSNIKPLQIAFEFMGQVTNVSREIFDKLWTTQLVQGRVKVIDDDGQEHEGEISKMVRFDGAQLMGRFGNLEFGEAASGHKGWCWREGKETGKAASAVTVMFTISPSGDLFIGGQYEPRPFYRGGKRLFTPAGGWADPDDKDIVAAARRELEEELGVEGINFHQAGEPGVFNRSYQYVPVEGDPDANQLVVFAMFVPWFDLKVDDDNRIVFAHQPSKAASAEAAKLGGCEFVRYEIVELESPDYIAVASVGRLHGWLVKIGAVANKFVFDQTTFVVYQFAQLCKANPKKAEKLLGLLEFLLK